VSAPPEASEPPGNAKGTVSSAVRKDTKGPEGQVMPECTQLDGVQALPPGQTLPESTVLQAVDVRSAGDDVLRSMFAVATQIEREDVPEPPWVPELEWVAELRADAGIQDRADWLVRDGAGAPVAVGHFYASRSGENSHRAKLVVQVAPAARRRGTGTLLLRLVTGAAHDAGRTVVQTWTTAAGPGAAFATRWGITAEDELELNRLRVARLDRTLIDRWLERAKERAEQYELVWWDGRCPDALRSTYAEVRQVMNTAPQVSDHVDEVFTVDKLDELEASWAEAGLPWWTVCARQRQSGRLVGYTELAFSDEEPALAYQGDTAVDPLHRGQGIGRWVKAAMLERMLRERRAVEVVDTDNAGSGDAMIAINRHLDFRVILRTERRRADLADLATRLG